MAALPLQSSDGVIFYIDMQVANCFGTIREMLHLRANDQIGGGADAVIPLSNVNSAILRKVLEWANFHKDDPAPPDDIDKQVDICAWDAGFLNVDQPALFGLLMAANYLNAPGLYDVVCVTIANMISGKTAEEIRGTFNIPNDLTPADEKRIREQNDLFKDSYFYR